MERLLAPAATTPDRGKIRLGLLTMLRFSTKISGQRLYPQVDPEGCSRACPRLSRRTCAPVSRLPTRPRTAASRPTRTLLLGQQNLDGRACFGEFDTVAGATQDAEAARIPQCGLSRSPGRGYASTAALASA